MDIVVNVVHDLEVEKRATTLISHFAETHKLPGISAVPGVAVYEEFTAGKSNLPKLFFPELGRLTWDMLFKFDLGNSRIIYAAFYYQQQIAPRLYMVVGAEWKVVATPISEQEVARVIRAWHRLVIPDASRRGTQTLTMPVVQVGEAE